MVLYRKYRPQSLDELIGQEVAKKSLLNAFLSDKLSHAYLFCGPRGTGKTSTARILAKMISCQKVDKKSGAPCNQCEICQSITSGSNLDLIEIDAASNRGIDDIRSLRETIKLSPSSLPKKIYIIDEVHMLTTEAFNALLKTLEEPPSHALFILATTEMQKLPQTILSRVSKIEFKLAIPAEIKTALKNVAEKESLKIDDEALSELARLSGGSFRDAIKLLDQLSSFESISAQTIKEVLGMGRFEAVVKILDLVADRQTSGAVELLLKTVEDGADTKQLNWVVLEVLRQLMLIQSGLGEKLVKPNYQPDHFASLVKLASLLKLNQIVQMIENFVKSMESLKSVSIQTLPLEVAIIQSIRVSEYQSIRKTAERIETTHQEPEKTKMAESASFSDTPTTDTPTHRQTEMLNSDIQTILDKWQYILETIRPHNYSLEALLRSVKIKEVNEKIVLLEVPYSFHQRILQAPKSKDLLESVLSDVLGRTIKISTVLGQRPVRDDELANIELAQDDEIIRVAAEIFSSDVVN